ncbi:hypothetical protein BS47DRAFT_1085545 [Hydnum rufescens UP504]|uniref:Uncharacterized protein n=1 Tax=Hydnum rufescens UP504 TaxID=1448309 RepID=A0A9P6DZP6_9AGAM|nr:hypothetical protein BS47DRAFT_1085545 [Hydnum rufescens UP504]
MGPTQSAPHASDEVAHSVTMTMNQDGVAPVVIVESKSTTIFGLSQFAPVVHKSGPPMMSEQVPQPLPARNPLRTRHHSVSGIISRTGVSKRPPTPPKGSLDSSRLYPSPSTSGVFQERSGNETLTHDLFGGSLSMHPSHSYLHHSGTRPPTSNDPLLLPPVSHPGRSILDSFPALGPEPSPSTGIGDQSGSQSFLSDPSDEPHPNFSRRSIVDTQLHYPYLSDSDPRSSSESSHTFPMQVATEKEEVEQEIVRSPYIFAPSSFPMAMGTNVAHTDPSVEATNHIPPFAYSTNFLPMAASRMRLFYNPLEDFGNDHQSHEDADEAGLGAFGPQLLVL